MSGPTLAPMRLGSPLQRIAMGMVIVIGTATVPPHPSPSWAHYDLLADPLGWLLVVHGATALARHDDSYSTARWLAWLAGAVSVPMWLPQVNHLLDASGSWFVSLPQLGFCLLMAREIGIEATRQQPPDRYAAKRFGLLFWAFAIVGVLPVVAIGGGVARLVPTTLFFSAVVSLVFVYVLFRVHRREWLAGPGPLEIAPHRRTRPDAREGRPPSS